ncbi:MAG TPA: hypothetical protein VFA79_05840 [Myxococcales bacterium]|nr:hypothetical protein [Myxococcales bacterium]
MLRRLIWPAVVLLAGVASAAPLWCSHLLPFQDAPQHLAALTVLAGQGAAAAASRPFFEVGFANAQYSGVYLAALALARFVGPDVALRLLLTVAALLLPLAAWMLLGSFERDRRLAVFAPALFQTATLFIGVYNFIAAVPVAILVVALVERQLRAPSRVRALLLAAVSFALLQLHLSGFVVALAAACVLALTRRSRRSIAVALAPFAPALAFMAVWALHAPKPAVPGIAQPGAVWQSPLLQIKDILRFANVFAGRVDEVFTLLLVIAFVAVVRQKAAKPRPPEGAYRMPLLAAGLLAAYLAAPNYIGYVAYIHLRAIPFLLMFAIASPVTAATRRTSALLAGAACLQVLYAPYVAERYRRFDREANVVQLAQVLSKAAPGQRMVSLMLDRKSKVVHFEPYLHFGLYYEVLRGGRTRFNFAELPWMPLRFRTDVLPARRYPVRWEFEPGYFDWQGALGDAEYVLVRTPDPDPDAEAFDSPEPSAEFASGWNLLERAGRWELFTPGSRPSNPDASSAGRRASRSALPALAP